LLLLWTRLQQRKRDDRKTTPPNTGREKRQAHGEARRESELLGAQDKQQIQDQQQCAAEITISVATARNFVCLVFRRDLRQECVVENIRRTKADVRDDEKEASGEI